VKEEIELVAGCWLSERLSVLRQRATVLNDKLSLEIMFSVVTTPAMQIININESK
jgi:hypothetical protein